MFLLLACVDYGVTPPPPQRDPGLEVRPAAVEDGACPDTPIYVDLASTGDTTLTVREIRIVGSEWTLDPVDLPLRIEPEHVVTIAARGVGTAELQVTSDAADAITVTPLTIVANELPSGRFVAPTDETSVPLDEDLELVAFVGDDDDAIADLSIAFASNLTGTLATVIPDASGRVTYLWPAAERLPGPQTATITVTDPCGGVGDGLAWFCQDGPYVVHPIVEEAWHYEGNAYIEREVITLTADATNTVATALDLATVFDGDDVELSLEVQLDAGGEGLSVLLLDADLREGYVGGDGCGLGFGAGLPCTTGPALPGWALAIDTHADAGDCLDSPHLAFYEHGDLTTPGPCVATPGIDDGGWHTLHLRIQDDTLRVELDGVEVIDEPVAIDFFLGMLGFGASTTDLPNAHRVRSVEAIDYTCYMGHEN
jgi:hypothetical protein